MNDIQICSNACIRLGVASFTSFSANTPASNLCAELYPQVRASLLSRHNWHFTIKQAQLSREVTTPAAKWAYQYILPADRLGNAPYEVFRSENAYQIPFTDWEIVGNRLMANIDGLWCQYVAQVDEADMPGYFTELLIKTMMLEICVPLLGKDATGMRTQLYTDVWGDFGEYQRAKTADSHNHPINDIKHFPLIDARHGATLPRWA